MTQEQLAENKKIVTNIESNRPLLKSMIAQYLDMHTPGLPVWERLTQSLAYGLLKTKTIVRPVDLLREALDSKGQFEVAGYYGGNLQDSCSSPRDPQSSAAVR